MLEWGVIGSKHKNLTMTKIIYNKPERLPTKIDLLLKTYNGNRFYEVLLLDKHNKVKDYNMPTARCEEYVCLVSRCRENPPLFEDRKHLSQMHYILWLDCYLFSALQPNRVFIQDIERLAECCDKHGVELNIYVEEEGILTRRSMHEVREELRILKDRKTREMLEKIEVEDLEVVRQQNLLSKPQL